MEDPCLYVNLRSTAPLRPGYHRAHRGHSEKKLESFHHSCLRRALGLKTTYYTKVIDPTVRTYSNADVLEQAQVPTVLELLSRRRMALLGRVLRAPQDDILRDVCLTSRNTLRAFTGPQRVGRPRQSWIQNALTEAWDLHESCPDHLKPPFILHSSLLQLHNLSTDRVRLSAQ